MKLAALAVLASISFGLVATQGSRNTSPAAIDPAKLVDLTWDFDERTIYWPTAKPFQWKKENWGAAPGGYWYAAASFSASEHGGTHLDSPIHFAENKATVDAIPPSQLVAPVVVVDVSAQAARERDYLLSAADLAAWEKRHGRIPAGSIALVRTGWGKFWPDKKTYLGDDTPGDASKLHFPGISKQAAERLVSRNVAAVGIDTASLDHGPSREFWAHRVLNAANIYGLENVAHLEKVPVTGATLIALPMKIKGGTGGPVRIIAVLP